MALKLPSREIHRFAEKLRAHRFAIWICFVCAVAVVSGISANWKLIRGRNLNKHVVSNLGHLGYLGYDSFTILKTTFSEWRLSKEDPQPYIDFLASISEQRNDAGLLPRAPSSKPKNVVYIQMESVDGISLHAQAGGKKVMPFLDSLSRQSLDFAFALDNSAAGRTTDGELLALASLVPLKDKPAYVSYSLDQTPSLPRELANYRYRTVSLHGFNPSFWNRARAHASLGFQESYFRDDLDDSDLIGWGISDKSLLIQAARILAESEDPVFIHAILLTNHHPYQHIGKKFNRLHKTIEENHIESLRYVDASIANFFKILTEQGILETCIIAIYGDHDSGLARRLIQRYELPYQPPINDTVPLLIYNTNVEPQIVMKASGLQDLPVIVLDQLGLPIPQTFIGNSLASNLPSLTPKRGRIRRLGDSFTSSADPVNLEKLTKRSILEPQILNPKNDDDR